MKKFYSLLFLLISLSSFSQINEDFEGISAPDASGNWALISGDWKTFDNGVGPISNWVPSSAALALNSIGRAADVARGFNGQDATSEDWLVMPRRLMRPNEQLRFFTRQGLNGDSGTLYQIRVSTNSDPTILSAYTVFEEFTETELNEGFAFNQYNEKVINMTQTGQQLFIAFVKVHTQPGTTLGGDRWLIDNVQLALRCVEPINLSHEQTTCNSARIKWTNPANASLFNVEVGLYPFDQGTSGNSIFQTNSGLPNNPSNLLTNLLPGTEYAYYVQAVCGPGRTSNWAGPYFFKTKEEGALCGSCSFSITNLDLPFSDQSNTSVYGDNITQTSPGTSCGGTGTYLAGQDVVYAYTPAADGQITISMNPFGVTNTGIFVYDSCADIGVNCVTGIANNNGNVRTIPTLNVVGGTTYYILISSTAATFSFEYLLTIQEVSCNPPTSGTAVAGMTSATLNWTGPTGATSWEYFVQLKDEQIPNTTGTTATLNPTALVTTMQNGTVLAAGTEYQYWVRADCGNGTFSPWVGPFLFTTTQCLIEDQCNYTFALTDIGSDGWEGGRMEVRQGGIVVATIGATITGGSQNVIVPLCDDLPFELFWSVGGTSPAEIGVSVRNSFGQTLFTMPSNSAPNVGTIIFGANGTAITECDFPVCQAVTGTLGTASITAYGATLNWTVPTWAAGLGFTYDVYISAAPFTVPDGIPTPNNSTTFLVENVLPGFAIPETLGLQQDTQYRYWVQINCTNNGPSPWTTNSGVWTTLPKCPKPTALNLGTMVVDTVGVPPTVTAPLYWTSTTPPTESAWVLALPVVTPATPSLLLTKKVTEITGVSEGDTIKYEFYVTNTGGLPINSLTISDPLISANPIPVIPAVLPPGNFGKAIATYTITAADVINSSVTNSATVNGLTTASVAVSDVIDAPLVTPLVVLAPVPFNPGAPWVAVPAGQGSLANQFQYTGLVPDTAYNYYVMNDCGETNGNSLVAGPRAFTTPPSCPRPTLPNVTAASITTSSATFTWVNGSPTDTQWEILLVPSPTLTLPTAIPSDNPSFPGQILTTVTSPDGSPYTINGLNAAQIYFYYIRTVCSSTNKSKWTAVKVFNTLRCLDTEMCDYRIWLNNYNTDGSIGANTWNGARLQIRQNGIIVSTVGTAQVNGNPIIVKLCPNVPYDLYWSVAGTSPDTIGFTFASPFFDTLFIKEPGQGTPQTVLYNSIGNCTPTGCLKPIPLAVDVTTITTSQATLTWTEQGTATQWEVFVTPQGTPAPINGNPIVGTLVGVSVGSGFYYLVDGTSSVTVTGLNPQTTYQFYVRAICPVSEISGWTILTPISFITKPINDNCAGSINVPVNPNRECTQFAIGNTLGASGSLPLTSPVCPGNTDDDVWFNFVATSTTHIININNIVGTATDINHTFYLGSDCGTLTQLYCSNPNISIATNLVIGNTYKIRVYTNGANLSQTATFEVCITTPAAVVNDNCNTATVAVVNGGLICNQTTPGSLAGATASTQGGTTCAGTEDDDIWFSFVANSTQQIIDILNVQGTNVDINHAVYSGLCNNLTLLYCSDPNQSTANGLTVGQTYFIRVWSAVATVQDITFDLCIGRILPPITANTTQYSTQQLIEDVFLNTTCANVTNITTSTGTNFGSVNGIGYFNRANSEFPFADGIVLSTGNAASVSGPNNIITPLSEGNFLWTGDDELEEIVLAGTGTAMNSNNASILEFDFTPISSPISFNFIFASEEYGQWQCGFSDSFAFILTDLTTGTVSNLAVLPNSATPVSVVTIRDQQFNPNCESQNVDYFGSFFGPAFGTGSPGINPLGDPIAFNGFTVPLTATSDVTPGGQYHIKLVIADQNDSAFDSAVFLEGDSFNIGNIELGNDFLEASGNAICPGDVVAIDSGLDPAFYSFTWFKNSFLIPNENNSTLNVSDEGVYTLNAQYGASTCIQTDFVTIEFIEDQIAGTPQNLTDCIPTGTSTFNLTLNEASILAPFVPGSHTAVFFTSFNDADQNNLANGITTPETFVNTSNPQTIYVRVNKLGTSCYQVVSFTLTVQDLTPEFTFAGDTSICPQEITIISVVPTDNSFDSNLVTYQWQYLGVNLDGETNNSITISGTNYGMYSCIVNNSGCINSEDVELVNSNTLWTLSATGTTSLCPNETGTINVSVSDNTTGSPEVYTYLLPDGTTSSETGNSLAITQTGTYTITVDILGCTNFINYTVTQSSANWIIVPTGPTSLCPNETGTITVDISNNINNYPEVYTYTLPNGSVSDDKDNSLEIVGGGTYQIEVDILGCKSFVDYTIQENNQEFLLDYQSGCNANNYTIEVKPKDNSFDLATSTFEWTDPNGQIISTESSCEATVIGLYTCIVSNSIGCTSVFSQPFTNIACEIQKGISPKGMGGDGKNDFFDLESLNVTKLSIFNRYGSKVYTKDNYSNEWFGQSDKGDELPDGTYYYVIELLNESSKTGWIYINREQ
jgi:gliding motility-associated-like protein/uncharacterized repeat protein (TIGR01451 family)